MNTENLLDFVLYIEKRCINEFCDEGLSGRNRHSHTASAREHLDKWHKPPTATQDQAELSQKLEQVLQRILTES